MIFFAHILPLKHIVRQVRSYVCIVVDPELTGDTAIPQQLTDRIQGLPMKFILVICSPASAALQCTSAKCRGLPTLRSV